MSQCLKHVNRCEAAVGCLIAHREGWEENIARQIQNTARHISETVRNRTHVHINFFFRMTNTMTSQNIDLSSWDTLYKTRALITRSLRPFYSSGGYSLASHRGGPVSITGQVIWYLWWTKWYWEGFYLNTFVSPCQFSFHQLLHIE
jgi:hypothetical protein